MIDNKSNAVAALNATDNNNTQNNKPVELQKDASAQQENAQDTTSDIWGVFNEEGRAFISSKGFKEPTDFVNSYKNIESKMGAMVSLPKDEKDEEGLNKIYTKLGRPEKPEGYKLPEGLSEDEQTIATKALPNLHKIGFTQKQAEAFMADMFAGRKEAEEKAATERKAAFEKEDATLKELWKGGFNAKKEAAVAAFKQFGADEEAVAGLESVLGYAKTMNFLANIGVAIGNHKAPSDNFNAVRTSSTSAQGRISNLMADKAFKAKYLAGDAAAIEEMTKLHKAAYGD